MLRIPNKEEIQSAAKEKWPEQEFMIVSIPMWMSSVDGVYKSYVNFGNDGNIYVRKGYWFQKEGDNFKEIRIPIIRLSMEASGDKNEVQLYRVLDDGSELMFINSREAKDFKIEKIGELNSDWYECLDGLVYELNY